MIRRDRLHTVAFLLRIDSTHRRLYGHPLHRQLPVNILPAGSACKLTYSFGMYILASSLSFLAWAAACKPNSASGRGSIRPHISIRTGIWAASKQSTMGHTSMHLNFSPNMTWRTAWRDTLKSEMCSCVHVQSLRRSKLSADDQDNASWKDTSINVQCISPHLII